MATPSDAENREAQQTWGNMLRRDMIPSDKLDRLLRGIAACISSYFGQTDNNDLAPTQLAAFYKTVGGNYDALFLDKPPQSIAFIYKSLGCIHSLQPATSDPHVSPTVPALKPKGFVTWQTIQLLLGPQEHVPFLQNALRAFDVRDPDEGTLFPKILPAACFPATPDPKMVAWHAGVSEHLRIEAERNSVPQPAPPLNRSSTELSVDGSADERADAAQYFSNPFNRSRDGKPGIIRQITNAPAKVFQGGKMVATTVFNGGKMVADPLLFSGRRRSLPDRSVSMDSSSGGHGDGSKPAPSRPRPRRTRTHSGSSADSDVDRNPPRRSRRYRSNDTPPESPGSGYFVRNPDGRETSSSRNRTPHPRSSRSPASRPAEFRPSGSPPLAARVVHSHYRDYFGAEPQPQQRPSMGQRASSEHRTARDHRFGPAHNHRGSVDGYHSDPRADIPQAQGPYQQQQPPRQPPDGNDGRDWRAPSQNPDRQVSFERDARSPTSRQPYAVNGVKGRRYPNETPWQ